MPHAAQIDRIGRLAIAAVVACGLACALGGRALADDPPATPPPSPASAVTPPKVQPAPSDDETWELIVQLRDGRRFTGPVVRQNAQEVVIRIAGISTRFGTEEIERLEVLEPFMERYKKLREAVGGDPEQIVRLAEWLQAREKYELALMELERGLAVDKTHGPSLRLKSLLEQQIILKHKRLQKDPQGDANEGHKPVMANRPAEFPVLTAPEVNLIKVYETKFEEKPRILVERGTITKVLAANEGHPLVPITREGRDAVLRQSPEELLDLMFKLQARDYYGEVQILDQPRAFVVFRDQICRTWLINACSTTQCHGGTEAGRLILQNRKPNSEQTVYTNFLILSKYRLNDGTALIDFEQPERSPLVQMGLPRDKSRRPHPEVRRGIAAKDAFKPVFRTTDDVQFKAAVDWIKSLYRPRPEYGIPYAPLRPFEPPPKTPPPPQDPAKPAGDAPPAAPAAPPKPR